MVAFICNHCPHVKHVRDAFARLARDYKARGVASVGCNIKWRPGNEPVW
jgi:hypothetical protein